MPKGRIPRNIVKFGHISKHSKEYYNICDDTGLPRHGAIFPYELAEFLVKFGSKEGDLVADPFRGSMTTALASHKNKRRFISTEIIGEYALGRRYAFR